MVGNNINMIKSADIKKTAVDQVIHKGVHISQVARNLGVARKTIYSWVKRYQQTSSRCKADAFLPAYKKGEEHFRNKSTLAKPLLLKLLVKHPGWGCRKLSMELKKHRINLGYIGVYELLIKNPLYKKFLKKNIK